MLELPESRVLAQQLSQTIAGKKVKEVTVAQTPHKLAWYFGDKEKITALLESCTIGTARPLASMVEIEVGNNVILISEGAGARFHKAGEPRPAKHQLLIEFEGDSALSVVVQMYGGVGCFPAGSLDNPYYKLAREKPSPFSPEFDRAYWTEMISATKVPKLSAKAFLATEQRIPGLGNGVLQDILFNAGIHPKRKINTLSGVDKDTLFNSIKITLSEMLKAGGRNTETDLFGRPGGYRTILSKNTVGKPCPICGTIIQKSSYLGGSIYYCEECQPL